MVSLNYAISLGYLYFIFQLIMLGNWICILIIMATELICFYNYSWNIIDISKERYFFPCDFKYFSYIYQNILIAYFKLPMRSNFPGDKISGRCVP